MTAAEEPFRTRRFVPVPPAERPRRHRSAARVVVTDGSHVLLFADTDPGLPGSRWWVTPGGGLDPDETPRQAAVRELYEETGLEVSADDLVGPIATRTAVHGYSDQVLSQREWFFVLRTTRFEPDYAGHTADEQASLDGHAWHPVAGLAGLGEPVWPADLAALLGLLTSPGSWPVDLGTVEESSLAVD